MASREYPVFGSEHMIHGYLRIADDQQILPNFYVQPNRPLDKLTTDEPSVHHDAMISREPIRFTWAEIFLPVDDKEQYRCRVLIAERTDDLYLLPNFIPFAQRHGERITRD